MQKEWKLTSSFSKNVHQVAADSPEGTSGTKMLIFQKLKVFKALMSVF